MIIFYCVRSMLCRFDNPLYLQLVHQYIIDCFSLLSIKLCRYIVGQIYFHWCRWIYCIVLVWTSTNVQSYSILTHFSLFSNRILLEILLGNLEVEFLSLHHIPLFSVGWCVPPFSPFLSLSPLAHSTHFVVFPF